MNLKLYSKYINIQLNTYGPNKFNFTKTAESAESSPTPTPTHE